MPEIQDRRSGKRVPGGRLLHEYANLYIHARNPMMYKRKEGHRGLCVLRISPDLLDQPAAVIVDRNASSDYARFGPPHSALGLLVRERVFAESWIHADEIETWRHRSEKCAEVLVPDRVDPVLILGAYVSCGESRQLLREQAPGLPITVDPHLFFR
jgi:hypothetical protein